MSTKTQLMVIFQSNVSAILNIVNNFVGSFYYECTLTSIIGKTSLSCCQNLCQFKVHPSCKVFGLQAIADLIMCEVPFLLLLMLISKT
jgi:hypothetical protein